MQSAADYRKHAQECVEQAEGKPIPTRMALLTIASEWLQLANMAEIQEAFMPPADVEIAPFTDTKQ